MLPGAGHGHIAQPPLLLHLLLVAHGAVAGEQAVLHTHHEHLGEFQTLGAVHGHHHHAVVALLGAVQIGVQRHLVQKARQAGIVRLVVQKGVDAGGQFLHVLQPASALHVVLLRQHGGIAAAVADEFIELRQGHLPRFGPHFLHQCCEALQLYSRRFQLRITGGMAEDLIQRHALCRGQKLGLVHGGRADLAGGDIDDAPQPQIVGGIVDDAQIRQHVLDLGPVEELHAADDLIGYAAALEGIFQRVGLGVHAVEHRVIPPVQPAVIVHHHLAHHKVGLVALVEIGLDEHLVPRAVAGPQGLALTALIVADHGVGRVQNVLGGAVVLLQPDHPGAAVLLLKAEDILDIGAPEAVDALVVVAHHADVAVAACQQAGQQVLQVVGVLILVHQHIAELPLIVFPHLRAALQQLHRQQNDIVKVQGVGVPQLFRVKGIYFRDPDLPPIVVLFPIGAEVLRQHHLVLCPGDDRHDLPDGEGLFVQLQLLQTVLHHPLAVVGVVDGKVAGVADLLDVPPQDADAGGVEGGRPHVASLLPQHVLQTLLQLVGGLVGEGDSQHLPGAGRLHRAQILHQRTLLRHRLGGIRFQKGHLILGNGDGDLVSIAAAAIAQQVGHPVDQHRGLAAARARQQQKRPLGGHGALLLHVVQIGVIQGNGLPPGVYEPLF